MKLDALADQLRNLADLLDQRGQLAVTRTAEWAHTTAQPGHTFPDPDRPTIDADTEADERADARAATLHRDLTAALRGLRDHERTARRIIIEATPTRPAGGKITPTDAAVDGWCRSCIRNQNHLEPIATGRYRDLCRRCGEWSATHNQHPPLQVLEVWHTGRKLTTVLYERITGRTA